MSFFKMIILLILMAFSVSPFAESTETRTLPPGKWKIVKISEAKKDLPLVDITLYAYKNKISLFDFKDQNGNCFKINNQTDYLEVQIDNYCKDEEFNFDKFHVNNNQLEVVDGDVHYFFVKEELPTVSYQDLTAVWEMAGNPQRVDTSIVASIYPDRFVSLIEGNSTEVQSGRVFIGEGNLPYIVVEDTFLPIFYEGNSFGVILDEKVSFKKTEKPLPSQFIVDDNGMAAEIGKFSVVTKINGDLAETILDIQFKTLGDRATEVAFKLPLPASASITGYSLDIKGKMIPAVVVPKETAREALETLESRGVDPALAELTHNNLFQTEIYPVSKDNPRRIQIRYQELLQKVNGEYHYSIPLELLGQFKHFSLDIEVDAATSIRYPQDAAISQQLIRQYKTNKGKQLLRFNADNFSARTEFSLNLLAAVKPGLQVQLADEQVFFRLPLDAGSTSLSPKSLLILWDTSLSMAAYHTQYVKWVNDVRHQFPNAKITVQPFSTTLEKSIDLSVQSEAANSSELDFVYDGASNLNLIGNFLSAPEQEAVLLFSDAIHSIGLLDLNLPAIPLFVINPDNKVSNMPLLQTLAERGNLASLKDFPSLPLRAFFALLDDIKIEPSDNSFIVNRQFGRNQSAELIGKLGNTELPHKLSVEINKVKKDFIVDGRNPIAGNNLQYLWATAKIRPLMSNPQQHKQAITDVGMKYSIVTPYTSLLVLEEMIDYVEFGVKPSALFDPNNRYDELRADYLIEKSEEGNSLIEELFGEWQKRVDWYKNPVAFNRKILKPKINRRSSGLDEVVVTGMRSAPAENVEEMVVADIGKMDGGIKVLAWNPDTPYLKAIKAVPLDKAYATYLEQRKTYGANLSFYMDVAKYFFDQKQIDVGYKIVSNISERMPEKVLAQRILAYCLMEYQQWDLAFLYLNFVNQIVPYEATSKRDLAVLFEHMASLEKPDFATQSANYYWQAILQDDSFRHDLAITSLGELNHLIAQWKIDPEKIDKFDKRFIAPMEFDVRVVMSWTNNQADMDLHILEPDATKISYRKPYSFSGGWLPFDNTSGFGPEEYLLKVAKKGTYKVKADFFANSSVETFGPVTVRIDIYRNYGKENEVHKITTVRLEDAKDELDLAEIMVH